MSEHRRPPQRCDVCDEPSEVGGFVLTCGHLLCGDCVRARIETASEERVPCSISSCNGYMDDGAVEYLVDRQVYSAFLKRVSMKRKSENGDRGTKVRKRQKVKPESDIRTERDDPDMSTGFGQLAVQTQFLMGAGYTDKEAQLFYENEPIIPTVESITCSICQDERIPSGSGIILKNCLHMACRDCLEQYIDGSDSPEVKCPHPDCQEAILPSEVREICSWETYHRHYFDLSLQTAQQDNGITHCMTPNCTYFCELNGLDRFLCPLCQKENCQKCKAQHQGMSCQAYENSFKEDEEDSDSERYYQKKIHAKNERLSKRTIEERKKCGKFRPCPNCKILIEKRDGCDHMRCARCHHFFSWYAAHPDSTKRFERNENPSRIHVVIRRYDNQTPGIPRQNDPNPSIRHQNDQNAGIPGRNDRSPSIHGRNYRNQSIHRRNDRSPSIHRRNDRSPSIHRRNDRSPSIHRRNDLSPSIHRRNDHTPRIPDRHDQSPAIPHNDRGRSNHRRNDHSPSISRNDRSPRNRRGNDRSPSIRHLHVSPSRPISRRGGTRTPRNHESPARRRRQESPAREFN